MKTLTTSTTKTTIPALDPSPLTLDPSLLNPSLLDPSKPSEITKLCGELKFSLRRPTRRTLTLIDKALSYLTPFESPLAAVTSPSERRELLNLLNTHRQLLSPYIDTDRIESHILHLHTPY